MKNNILFSLFLTFAIPSIAQPTLTKCEKYQPNTIMKYYACDPNVPQGDSGANVTWDFSSIAHDTKEMVAVNLSYTDTVYDANIHKLFIYTDTLHLYLNLDSQYTYTIASNKKSYIQPIILKNGKIVSKHNINYLDTLVDSFERKDVGFGRNTIIADGYGTLILPNKTYNNILRIRIEEEFTDTTSWGGLTYHSILYKWYDTAHTSYLLAKQSLIDGTYASIHFLSSETVLDIHEPENVALNFSAGFDANRLVLTGDFHLNRKYQVSVFNEIGQLVYESFFNAESSKISLSHNTPFDYGIYLLRITEVNSNTVPGTFKVLHQTH